jgi:hypothetical protein
MIAVAALAAAGQSGRPSQAAADACASLSLPGLPACKATMSGVVLAATMEEAEAAAAAANQGEERFRRHVGPVTRYAVVVTGDAAGAIRSLRASGYDVVLPWLNPAARRSGLEESVRRSTEARLAGRGMTREQIDGAVASALAQVRGGGQGNRLLASYAAVAHELGHLWLIHGFWPRPGAGGPAAGAGARAGHYGGPAPDWLDEAAAIAMEDEPLTAPRRTRFRELQAGRVGGRVESLATFFRMDHPLKGVGQLIRSGQVGSGGTDNVTVLTGQEVESRLGISADAGPNFYAQARVVADFLMARSGDPAILGDIAQHLARGETMEQWLAARGPAHGLPGTMTELDANWTQWVRTQYGEPAVRNEP